jgi:hypothetical protein
LDIWWRKRHPTIEYHTPILQEATDKQPMDTESYKTNEEKEMIDNKSKRTKMPQVGNKNTEEPEQLQMWDNPAMLILFLDSFGLEIINDTGYLPLDGPLYVKCNFEIAKRIQKSFHFNVALCGDNIWRISLDGMDHHIDDDPNMISWEVENRKEFPTRKAEEWLDMVIEYSNVGSIEGKENEK